jgi:cupin 2 domain-containing protein
MRAQNLLRNLPSGGKDELIETLFRSAHTRIERIVSHGHASPDGFWYDQPEDEFVVLLSGAARLRFADEETAVELRPGDSLLIPAKCRHRVEWTAPSEPSVWLAVFCTDG